MVSPLQLKKHSTRLKTLVSAALPAFAVVVVLLSTGTASGQGTTSLEGQLLDETGSPLAGYVLRAVNINGQAAESAPTTRTGRFAFNGLPAGRYEFTLLDGQRRPCANDIPPATVVVGGELSITLRLDQPPSCTGDPLPEDPNLLSQPTSKAASNGGKFWTRGKVIGAVSLGALAAILLLDDDDSSETAASPTSP